MEREGKGWFTVREHRADALMCACAASYEGSSTKADVQGPMSERACRMVYVPDPITLCPTWMSLVKKLSNNMCVCYSELYRALHKPLGHKTWSLNFLNGSLITPSRGLEMRRKMKTIQTVDAERVLSMDSFPLWWRTLRSKLCTWAREKILKSVQ